MMLIIIVQAVSSQEVNKLKAQYEWNLYKALSSSAKRSLDILRRNIDMGTKAKGESCV